MRFDYHFFPSSTFAERGELISAVGKLDGVLMGVAILILFFICLLLFNPNDTVQSLVPLATLVLGFRFVLRTCSLVLFSGLLLMITTVSFSVTPPK